jgi:uncharacterized membrane protein YqiK
LTYRERLNPVSEFLLASHQREAQWRAEEERVRQAELDAAREKQAAAEALAIEQQRATARAQADAARLEESRKQLIQAFRQASALRLTAEAPAMLSGARAGGTILGLLKLLAAHRIAPHIEIEGAMLAQVFAFERVEKIIETGSPVGAVAFSSDGHCLVSGSADKTLRLWDVQTGQPLGEPLRGHGGSVLSVAFSPDGRCLVSGSQDETLRLWPAPKVWPDMLCAKLTRNMSRKEWREQVSPDIEYLEQCPGLPIPPDATTEPLTRSATGET